MRKGKRGGGEEREEGRREELKRKIEVGFFIIGENISFS